jgi:hypothetical protein
MSTPIKAAEVAPMIWDMLVKTVDEEYAGEPESVKQEALFDILTHLTFKAFS